MLVSLISVSYKAKTTLPSQGEEWTAPTTIGGQAVVALAELASTEPATVSQALENDYVHITEYMECWNPELQDSALLLLFRVSHRLHPLLKDRIVNLTGFNGLRRMLLTTFPKKRLMALKICMHLYSESDQRKDRFMEREGAQAILSILTSTDLQMTKVALKAIDELVKV